LLKLIKNKWFPSQTVRILSECIADIDAGLWTCNVLVKDKKGPKPMGCALGLVGMNSGAYKIVTNDYGISGALVDYPDAAEEEGTPWPKAALKAVDILAAQVRLTDEYPYSTFNSVDKVVTFNDKKCPDASTARAWFVRALDIAKRTT
jgi:hypothetical protein